MQVQALVEQAGQAVQAKKAGQARKAGQELVGLAAPIEELVELGC